MMYITYVNSSWHIVYYETVKGVCPVREFIDSQRERDQAKIFAWLSLLEAQGPTLPRPYADLLTEGIHELRIKLSGDQVRILYFFCFRDFIVVTHAFVKQTSEVPRLEIRKAQTCRADFLSRFDEKNLREAIDDES
jgi:phage-related protein